MEKKEVSRIERMTNQLEFINSMLNMSKEDNDSLGVRQYEPLKKQYVQNLYKMLAENYQILIPVLAKEAA